MPGWDGLTTLEHIMASCPTPVIILSAHSKEEADVTIKCLNVGAVSFVLKPSGELSLDIDSIKDHLIKEVKAASRVKVKEIGSLLTGEPKEPKHRLLDINKIVIIGASTGGPKTLETVVSSIPSGFSAPILIVQHMPTVPFTQSLARHLNSICQLPVIVAGNDENIQGGRIYLAPGGFHMRLRLRGTRDERRRMRDEGRRRPSS